MLVVRIIHQASLEPLDSQQQDQVIKWTKTFFLKELCEENTSMVDDMSPSGAISLVWASLLARQYHSSNDADQQFGEVLQTMLSVVESMHGFQYFNSMLRSLVFSDDSTDPDLHHPFLQPLDANEKSSWQLPLVPGTGHVISEHDRNDVSGRFGYRVSIYQHVAASFFDDMLVSMGYLNNLDDVHQLEAMVRLIVPVIANSQVAEQLVHESSELQDGDGDAINMLVQASSQQLPENLLSFMRVYTALCSDYTRATSPMLLHVVLKEFSRERKVGASGSISVRSLPPDEYFRHIDSSAVECVRSFVYDEDKLMIPAGTKGSLDDPEQFDSINVQWHLHLPGNEVSNMNVWDLLAVNLEHLITDIQNQTLIHTTQSSEMSIFTSFFEWLVQVGQTHNSGMVLEEIGLQWTQARLRRWWYQHQLPAGKQILPVLHKQRISLSMLQSASREDLVAWGIRDRFIREQVLAHVLASTSSSEPMTDGCPVSLPYESDGFAHLMKIMLGFLDSFLHDRRGVDDYSWSTKQMHFITAVVGALSVLTSVDCCVDVLMNHLGGGTEECVSVILRSSKKLFEYHERKNGEYPVVFAAIDTLMNVIRWFLSMEAQSLDSAAENVFFIDAEKNWFVGSVEFVLEVLSSYESWEFASMMNSWKLRDRCFRVLFSFLSTKFTHERNSMLKEFQNALLKTMTTDMTFIAKLLRTTGLLLSPGKMQLHAIDELDNDAESASLSSMRSNAILSEDKKLGLLPFTFENDLDLISETTQKESLVITCLKLLDLIMEIGKEKDHSSFNPTKLLLSPIDDGMKKKTLNLVTLSGGYIAYPLRKDPGIAFWSLRLLQHAASTLLQNQPSGIQNSTHSLVALFRAKEDLQSVRDALLQLLRAPKDKAALKKELVVLLTNCLEYQPGFLAFVVFDQDAANDTASSLKTQKLTAMIDQFLMNSEQLLEEGTDLFCALLNFLLQVWKGANKHGLTLHSQIAEALRTSTSFWKKLTQALKVRMTIDLDEESAMDIDSVVGNTSSAYFGRSSPYGYLARGIILEIISFEWYSKCTHQPDHPLAIVLDDFRKEGLFTHWLRTFTRMDYVSSQFSDVIGTIAVYCHAFPSLIESKVEPISISDYQQGLVCGWASLQWQLEGIMGARTSTVDKLMKRVRWSNLQAAFVHSQGFCLARWKFFMEVCCLQAGAESFPGASSTKRASISDETSITHVSGRNKRKESMISSPVRVNTSRGPPPSPLNLNQGDMDSNFAGDRTSFGMIQVLSDILFAKHQQHEEGAPMDYFTLLHLQYLVELLVSMLHHQFCIVLQKTRDPRFSHTRLRESQVTTRLNVPTSLKLLDLLEKTTHHVITAISEIESGFDTNTNKYLSTRQASVHATIWKKLVDSFDSRATNLALKLRTSLLSASLLLVRHIIAIQHEDPYRPSRIPGASSESYMAAVLQVKWVGHCMDTIRLCDSELMAKNVGESDHALFQVSWCLLQELVDGFDLFKNHEKRHSDDVVALRPLILLLEHEQNGLRSLFHILIRQFQKSSNSVDRVVTKEKEANRVLEGLTAIVWNIKNQDLCHRVFLAGPSDLRIVQLISTDLIPLLRAKMEKEEGAMNAAGACGLRGYVTAKLDGPMTYERSAAHEVWCTIVNFVAGLIHLQKIHQVDSKKSGVWDFVAQAEPLFMSALLPLAQLSSAVIEEQQAVLRLFHEISAIPALQKQWRLGFPTTFVRLMERSRMLFRRACVLLASPTESKPTTPRKSRTSIVRSSAFSLVNTLTPVSSALSGTYAQQTLLHEHLRAVSVPEKRKLSAFYAEMQTALIEIVRQASFLLLSWTSGVSDSTLVVGGARCIDEEKLIPLLAFLPASEAKSMGSEPCLGHLCLAMVFMLDKLESTADDDSTSSIALPKTSYSAAAIGNALNSCVLLFLKTYLLHVEQYEYSKEQVDELYDSMKRINERVGTLSSKHVDSVLFQTTVEVSLV